eukprot:Sdes_comp20510_c0_seq2m15019
MEEPVFNLAWFSPSVPAEVIIKWETQGGRVTEDPQLAQYCFSDTVEEIDILSLPAEYSVFHHDWVTDSIEKKKFQSLGRYLLPRSECTIQPPQGYLCDEVQPEVQPFFRFPDLPLEKSTTFFQPGKEPVPQDLSPPNKAHPSGSRTKGFSLTAGGALPVSNLKGWCCFKDHQHVCLASIFHALLCF